MPGVGDRRLGVAGDEHAGDDGDRGRFLSSGDEGIDLALQRVDRLQTRLQPFLDGEQAHASFTRPRAYCWSMRLTVRFSWTRTGPKSPQLMTPNGASFILKYSSARMSVASFTGSGTASQPQWAVTFR